MQANLSPLFADKRLLEAKIHADGQWLVNSQLADAYGHWAYTRSAAMRAAAQCGIPIAPHEIEKKTLSIVVVAPCAADPGIRSLFDESGVRKGFEEEGGPGLEACFNLIDNHSATPIADIHALLLWTIASYILGHTEQHAGHVVLQNKGQGLRLTPFPWMTIFPGSVASKAYPLAKGFRIGPIWPDDYLRVDCWVKIAKWARVHPKMVFSMIKELANAMPDAIKSQLELLYGENLFMNTPSRVLELARRRAQRLLDLHMSAPGQGVAGVKRAVVLKEIPEKIAADFEDEDC